jgi:hypothetical protein
MNYNTWKFKVFKPRLDSDFRRYLTALYKVKVAPHYRKSSVLVCKRERLRLILWLCEPYEKLVSIDRDQTIVSRRLGPQKYGGNPHFRIQRSVPGVPFSQYTQGYLEAGQQKFTAVR